MAEQMTVEDARHALWHVGDPQGWQPRTFSQSLISTISHADRHNRARLWLSYPGLIQALHLSRTEAGRQALIEHCGATK